MLSDKKIKQQLIQLLKDALEGVNQDGCEIEVVDIDHDNAKVLIQFDLVVVEEDSFAGFAGY